MTLKPIKKNSFYRFNSNKKETTGLDNFYDDGNIFKDANSNKNKTICIRN
jgi:hypothetical protein